MTDEKKAPKRESLLLPIIIPIAVLLGIVVFAVSLGLLYLSMSAEAATLTALAVLVGLVLVTGLVSRAKQGGVGGLVVMGATFFGVALLVGGVSLATFGQPHHEAEGEGEGEHPSGVVVDVVAKEIAFDPTDLSAPTEPFTLHFDNQDAGIQHNVRIFEGETPEEPAAFDGEVITGPASIDYEVPALSEGKHAFDCKIHPNMQGVITVAGGGGAPGGAVLAESAKDIAFVKGSLEAEADAPFTIEFDNQDAGIPHNIRIFEGETPEDPVHFAGELVTGPVVTTYAVDPLSEGTYLFDCEVHPNMQGHLTIKGSVGEEKPPPPPEGESPPPKAPPEEPEAPPEADAAAIAAKDIAFDTDTLEVVADAPFTIEFDNQDAGVPHNVEIFGGATTSELLHFDGELITGPAKVSYAVDALPPGEYLFDCKVHPNMQGMITAG